VWGRTPLTRKRSQVQTLSRPPPFSQVKALPAPSLEHPLHTWAALGPHAHPRRQARWPFRARPPGAPGSTATTESGRASRPRGQPRDRHRNGASPPAPVRGSAASQARPRGGLASWSVSVERGRRPSTAGQLRDRHLRLADLTCGRPSQRRLRLGRLEPLTEPPGTTWNSTRSGREGAAARCGPHSHRRADAGGAGRDRPDGRAPDGRTPDSGHQTGWTPDGRTPDGLDDRIGRMDTEWWTRTGGGRQSRHPGIPTAATTQLGRRLEARPGRGALGDQQPGQLGRQGHCQRAGPGHRRDQTAAGWHAAVQPAPWRIALLRRCRVERRARRWPSSVMARSSVAGRAASGGATCEGAPVLAPMEAAGQPAGLVLASAVR
jgi:hypothetical protein